MGVGFFVWKCSEQPGSEIKFLKYWEKKLQYTDFVSKKIDKDSNSIIPNFWVAKKDEFAKIFFSFKIIRPQMKFYT